MIHFEPIDFAASEWRRDFETLSNRTIYQHPAWLRFVAETQRAEPVIVRIVDGVHVGYFTGLIKRRFGVRVLGSPFPGWSTSYMGFALPEGFPRAMAMKALIDFGLRELDCAHIECMDRQLSLSDAANMGLEYNTYTSFELDLRPDENTLLSNMAHEKRTNLRKAAKNGLIVEEAKDEGFAEEYYAQLCEVFQRQSLSPTYPLEYGH
jgi:hypothetical protein